MKTAIYLVLALLICSCKKDKIEKCNVISGNYVYYSLQHAGSEFEIMTDPYLLTITNDSIVQWNASFVKSSNQLKVKFENGHVENIMSSLYNDTLTMQFMNGNRLKLIKTN